MDYTNENCFVLKGEIAEVLSDQSIVKARIICKPGTMVFEVPSSMKHQLGDEVIISGKFICEKIENINHFNTNQ